MVDLGTNQRVYGMREIGNPDTYGNDGLVVPWEKYDVVRKRIEELGTRLRKSKTDVHVIKRLGSLQQQCWTLEGLAADARDKYEEDVKRWIAARHGVSEDVVQLRGLIERERSHARKMERKKLSLMERRCELQKKLDDLDEWRSKVKEMDASVVETSEAAANKKRRLVQLESARRDLRREDSDKSALVDKLRRRYRLRSYEVDNVEDRLAELVHDNLRSRVEVGRDEEELANERAEWEERINCLEGLKGVNRGVTSRIKTSQADEKKHGKSSDGCHHVRFETNLWRQNVGNFGAFREGPYRTGGEPTDQSESVEGESLPPTTTTIDIGKSTFMDTQLSRLQDDDEMSVMGGG